MFSGFMQRAAAGCFHSDSNPGLQELLAVVQLSHLLDGLILFVAWRHRGLLTQLETFFIGPHCGSTSQLFIICGGVVADTRRGIQ
jgi:hypothetical protein